ncbi:hypothetical protein NDU88_004424 [Pleurodeles waltl]|uniref:Uncharacterized protein n=1 Tax=Pleurodeles waltl TaxID=8319 RepID=A0AAV7UH31_PLEWA|nr:hypothetical protein NDU88_004424 [Pleurodeles waltl]
MGVSVWLGRWTQAMCPLKFQWRRKVLHCCKSPLHALCLVLKAGYIGENGFGLIRKSGDLSAHAFQLAADYHDF